MSLTIIDVTVIIKIQIPHRQIRCDNSCPLQSYTPNDVIVSKFERLAQKFPQTAKLVEVSQGILAKQIFYISRLASPHWASV